MRYLSDRYRPELHYMRGPGPKWLEKHAAGAIVIDGNGHDGAATPLRRIETMLRRLLPAGWRAAHRPVAEVPWSPAGWLGPRSV